MDEITMLSITFCKVLTKAAASVRAYICMVPRFTDANRPTTGKWTWWMLSSFCNFVEQNVPWRDISQEAQCKERKKKKRTNRSKQEARLCWWWVFWKALYKFGGRLEKARLTALTKKSSWKADVYNDESSEGATRNMQQPANVILRIKKQG